MLFCASSILAQEPSISLGPWHLTSVSGELGMEGMYQRQSSSLNDFQDTQSGKYLIGGIKLNTSSYLWDPGIVSLIVGGEFNPETRDEQFLIIPDRSEVRTLERINLRSTFFGDKALNFSAWLTMDQHYFNRENLTNILTHNRIWGTTVGSSNKILPFTIHYSSRDWEQDEVEANRVFSMKQNSLHAQFNKSFREYDKHDLSYSYDTYEYSYAEPATVNNQVHRVALTNHLNSSHDKRIGYRSSIMLLNQEGSYDFEKLDIAEQLTLHLPRNVNVVGSYNLYRFMNSGQNITSSKPRLDLEHKLYESLFTRLFAEQVSTWRLNYRENEFRTGASVNYTKKIPIGRLTLDYGYYRHHNTTEGEPGIIHIIDEPLILDDAGSNFLSKPFADMASVIVRDETRAIQYIEGSDYFLNSVNDFIEIVRIPGGRISPSASVLVNYDAFRPGDSHFEANNHSYRAGVALFDNILEVYYRGGMQDFQNVSSAEFLTLNIYTLHVVGGKINYRFLTGGVEFDRYNSSLIPYERMNYYLNLHFNISQRWILSANSSLRDYQVLGSDVDQRFMNISGRASYRVARFMTINLHAGYLEQEGQNIDLGLLTGRLEAVFEIRKMYLKTGIIYYSRNYSNSNFMYSRAFIRLARII